MIKKNIDRIPSRLYHSLYEKASEVGLDPDKLISAYIIVKKSRTSEKYLAYTSNNNKYVGGYSLLRKETPLSIHVLKKYLPYIIELDLIKFMDNGDVYIKGTNKLKNEYNGKLIPIEILDSFSKTAKSSLCVRLHSSKKNQLRAIKRKKHQRELLLQLRNPKSHKVYKKAKAYVKKHGEEAPEINDKVILSTKGYSELKGGTSENPKSRGEYYRNSLKELGLIKSKRSFKIIKKTTYEEYRQFKQNCDELKLGKYTYFKGNICEELPSYLIPNEKQQKREKREIPKKPVYPTYSNIDVYNSRYNYNDINSLPF